ncbi:NAD(P)/FAD-dependent oxidoreductase [Actinomadura sp. LD22]|uniref:NAD(P)/FAD-dependent oxidoreductase n=1 Tax=Actinomadura physcomitrii TaxID=2650748 RepID=A0A6I4MCN2_9ACTN|nr:NAD(P)/FAD-dependent oxidoreductase [Actinomadura physcomitrii]
MVVVGAGLGGLRTAEQLRAKGFRGELVIVGDEEHRPYTRPPLSKELLAGTMSPPDVAFDVRADLGAHWRLGTGVAAARLDERVVVLEDGEELGYDGLVIATGVRPRRLPVPGPEADRFTLRNLAHSLALRRRLRAGVRLCVIGAGFIGCEVAATARRLGAEVTVIAPESVPMERPLGREFGGVLRELHESRGVRFMLGHEVSAFEAGSAGREVVLSDGCRVPFDVAVEAVGSVPAVEWLAGNGLDLSDGVACDGRLRVQGRREVVAVGDVARFPNALFGGPASRVEHWNIPVETARRAAATLVAGLTGSEQEPAHFGPLPAFWSNQFDTRLQSYGAPWLGAADVRLLDGDWTRAAEPIMAGYHRDGELVGVVGTAPPRSFIPHRTAILAAAKKTMRRTP